MKVFWVQLKILLKRLKIRTNVVVMKINTICPGILKHFTVTYRVKLISYAVFLLNVIFKIVMRQNRRGKNMIHTATTEMNLKKGLHGKVCIFYPVLNFGRRTWIRYDVMESHLFFLTTLKLQKQIELHSQMVNDTATTFRTWRQHHYIIPSISIWTRLLSPWVCLSWALI